LETTQAHIPQFVKQDQQQSKVITFSNLDSDTDFVKWLKQGEHIFFEQVKLLGPSKIDIEIREYPVTKLDLLLHAISTGVDSKRDYEFYQSLLYVILKVLLFH
jgi:hypothetical protein